MLWTEIIFKVDMQQFAQQLLRHRQRVVGHYDSRLTDTLDPSEGQYDPRGDPSLKPTLGILDGTSVLLRGYLSLVLGFQSDLSYTGPFGGFWPLAASPRGDWMYVKRDRSSAGATTEAGTLMLRRNIRVTSYPGRHIMYHNKAVRIKLQWDIAAFMQEAVAARWANLSLGEP